MARRTRKAGSNGEADKKAGQRGRDGDPTRQEYQSFADAFDYFNRGLFGGALPPCYITLQRKANAKGYYSHQVFGRRSGNGKTDEIALNPAQFVGRTDAEVLSTLVHEMVHEWQAHHGSPSRGRYHNREWADKMEEVGLMPSNTGGAGGRRTGQRMSHYIMPGDLFDRACQSLLGGGFQLNWQACDPATNGRAPGPDPSKVKYTCPACAQNAWAKSGASLLCGTCGEIMAAADGNTGPCPAYRTAPAAAPPPNAAEALDAKERPPEPEPPWQPILKRWFAQLAQDFHPDKTGDDGKVMAVLNEAYDRLRRELET
jgi:hypothetical protein